MERSGAPSGWSHYQYEQGNGYSSQLGSSHQSFLTSTGCRGVGPIGAYESAIPSPHPQSGCHFDTTPNNKNVHNSLTPRFPSSVQHRTEIFARDEVPAPITSSRRFFSWYPSRQPSLSGWPCDVCSEEFLQSHALRVHFHQFHLNPHHLSPEDTRLFRLSNFLVNLNEDKEIKTEYPGLYRCHECFNVFNKSCSLRTHLRNHQEEPSADIKTMVVAKMAPKIDKLSREDFEDVSPREKRQKTMKSKLKAQTKMPKKGKVKQSINGLTTTIQQKIKSKKSKEAELQSDPSDEFTSDSEKEKDLISKGRQKNRKSIGTRRKLALGSDNITDSSEKSLDNSLCSSKESENGSHTSDQIVNGHVLESIDNVISNVKNEFVVPEDEINLINTMDENKSPDVEENSSEFIPLISKSKKRRKKQKQKKRIKNGTLKQIKDIERTTHDAGDLKGINSSSKRINKNNKLNRINDGITNSRKSKFKSPVKEKSSPKKSEVSSKIKDSSAKTSVSSNIKKRPKSDKLWRPKIRDHSKASNLVEQLVQPAPDFICLKCSNGYQSYAELRRHKLHCKNTKIYPMYADSKNLSDIKQEIDEDYSQELFEYVTGSVTDIPETTFNNMHGKISDLNTEDAQKFSSNPLNEIGLVKLNYSGKWSVKDVWESGGWEPRDDQLTWQQYELSSAISKHMHADDLNPSSTEQEVKSDLEDNKKIDENTSDIEISSCNKSQAAPSVTDLAHSLTRKLTTQIVSRKAPLITCSSMDRRLVTKLARLSWSEQQKVKEKFDASLVAKRTKRVSLSGENGQNTGHCSGIRQSSVTNRLDLKQLGRSVKYMKVGEREAQAKERGQKKESIVEEGKLSGEWEIEHSFLCSVCGIEYDDVLEILHHKWESHPHCLVTHVSLKEGVVRPPALLYPQVGPSTIHLDPSAKSVPTPPPLSCSKCSEEFSQTSDEINDQFHSHLLSCGGVNEHEGGKNRKRKRRGHGGGLKRTVRMIQKGNSNSDTEDASPKKRSQPPKKIIKPIPLIPTHSRTTRFKESKKKEARKLAARERRSRAKVEKSIRSKDPVRSKSKEMEEQEKTSSDKVIVAEVLEKVISTVEKRRSRPDRPRGAKKSKETLKKIKENQRERRLSVVRARQMNLYREQSSESEDESEESEPGTEITHAQERTEQENGKNITGNNSAIFKRKTRVVQTPKQPVLIKIENDENLHFITDLDTVNPYVESPVRGMSPSKTPVRGRSPLKAIVSESTSSSSSVSLVKLSRDNTVQSSDSPELSELDKDISSPKSASRSLKRLETNLVSKLLLPTAMEDDSRRRNNLHVTYKSKFPPSRFVFPIELKISAIARVESGETQVAVARDLNINTATLAAWWLRRSEIKSKFEREVMLENGDDMKSTFAISNLLSKFKKEEREAKQEDKDFSSDQENEGEEKVDSRRKSCENRMGLPLHVKANALKEIIDGKTQAAVAKELGINPSTVAHWWAKKDLIIRKHEASTGSDPETGTTEISSNEEHLDIQQSGNEENTSNDVITNSEHNKEATHHEQKRRSFDGRKFSHEVRSDALQRLDNGETKASIAKLLGVGLTTLRMWNRKRNSERQPGDDLENEGTNANTVLSTKHKKEPKYSVEMKVEVIKRIATGENISVVAQSFNVSENSAEAWWKRKDKILRKNKQSKLTSSKVFTSQDENTVNIIHENEKNLDKNIASITHEHEKSIKKKRHVDGKADNIADLDIGKICEENSASVSAKVGIEERRGRRHHTSVSSQQSPIPSGRLYMPLEVKQSVIKRIEEGATQVEVARDLDMSLSTVASWWRKKETILQNLIPTEQKKMNPALASSEQDSNLQETNGIAMETLFEAEAVAVTKKDPEDIKPSKIDVTDIVPSPANNDVLAVTIQEDIISDFAQADIEVNKDIERSHISEEQHIIPELLENSKHLNANVRLPVESESLIKSETDNGARGPEKAILKEQKVFSNSEVSKINDENSLLSEEKASKYQNEGSTAKRENSEIVPAAINGEFKNESTDNQEVKSNEKDIYTSYLVNEMDCDTEPLEEPPLNGPKEEKLLEIQHDISETNQVNSVLDTHVKTLEITEEDTKNEPKHDKIKNTVEAVTVADIFNQSIATEDDKNNSVYRFTPSPDNAQPNGIKTNKVIKKKSLDFLANSLMKKALERSQTQLTPLPSELSQSSSSISSHCHIVQENSVLSEVKQNPSSPPSVPIQTQSSGLGLIVASYCSSDDEL